MQRKDLWSGILFIAFGVFFLVFALDHPIGTSSRMGPGYFPAVTGGILIVLGTIISGRAVMAPVGEAIERLQLRPLFLLLFSVLLFALLLNAVGLPLAILIAVVTAGLAREQFRPVELLLLGVLLSVGSTLVFVWALHLPFPLWVR
jgi:phosphate/sulfate permease